MVAHQYSNDMKLMYYYAFINISQAPAAFGFTSFLIHEVSL